MAADDVAESRGTSSPFHSKAYANFSVIEILISLPDRLRDALIRKPLNNGASKGQPDARVRQDRVAHVRPSSDS